MNFCEALQELTQKLLKDSQGRYFIDRAEWRDYPTLIYPKRNANGKFLSFYDINFFDDGVECELPWGLRRVRDALATDWRLVKVTKEHKNADVS